VQENPILQTRVLLVGDHKSTHIDNWITQLRASGIEIESIQPTTDSSIRGFLSQLSATRKATKNFKPEIVHYHFASRYGLILLLSPFRRNAISVWGSDITVFPQKSFLHAALIRAALSKAQAVMATSQFLKTETQKYCKKEVTVTPFGIDTDRFCPRKHSDDNNITRIGCIKSYREIYGISDLIEAYSMVQKKLPNSQTKLIIAGAGNIDYKAERLLSKFSIDPKNVEFLSSIPHSDVHTVHQSLDIAVYPSLIEGYGVSALESSACGIPVIASNVGGHKEVVLHEKTGLLVPAKSPASLAENVIQLITDRECRTQLGKQGRQHVVDHYSVSVAVQLMRSVYQNMIAENPSGTVS